MTRTRPFFALWILLFAAAMSACSGRTPKPAVARKAIMNFYKHYGKKYPSSDFGAKNLSNVGMGEIVEDSYKVVNAEAEATLVDGHTLRTLVRLEKKFPRGWVVTSWEKLPTQ